MNHVWKNYQEELQNNNSSIPFNFEENYNSSSYKHKSSNLILKDKFDKGVLFLAETLKEEVIQGTKKEQKKKVKQLKKLFVQLAMISMTIGLGTSLEILTAQPLTASANSLIPTTTETSPLTDINPTNVMKWGLTVAMIVVSVGIAVAISLFAIAGIYLMFTRKRKEASEWTSDIIRGLTQVIVSIPLVYALFQLAQYIFKSIPFLDGLM